MQFHLNGFVPGDPDLAPSSGAVQGSSLDGMRTDVLVVGSGPAGLALVAQLSAFPDIDVRLVERKLGPLKLGQADGIACRTMEMFQAFGFARQIEREAYWVNEVTFWQTDGSGVPERTGRVPDTEEGLSEFPHLILNQARVHDRFLERMAKSSRRLRPDYGRVFLDLSIDETSAPYPVSVRLERCDPGHEGEIETLYARYVVGCDGARSSVRRSLGLELKGDSASQTWGVMDVLVDTDFPDIRLKSLIRSPSGTVLLIPREGGYLVRFYIELGSLADGRRLERSQVTADDLVAAASAIFSPFSFDVRQIAWWSVYQVGQRLCDRFDNSGANTGVDPRVFIAGDACHTHSPKAGQGMNVSMQDAFNLGWKLAHVVQGIASPSLLKTYSAERHAVAHELIEFDREWAALVATAREKGDPALAQDYFVRHGRYTAGVATRYSASILTGEEAVGRMAAGFPVGMRFHSAPVIRLADVKRMQLGHVAAADGRWRLYLFAGSNDRGHDDGPLAEACRAVQRSGLLQVPDRSDADVDAFLDVRAIFQRREGFDISTMPSLLRPRKGVLGLVDYEKVFVADDRPGADIFDLRTIDRTCGCMVLVRPDQYVSLVLPFKSADDLIPFFERIAPIATP